MSGGAKLALAGAALVVLAVLATLTSEPRGGRSGARRPPADPRKVEAKRAAAEAEAASAATPRVELTEEVRRGIFAEALQAEARAAAMVPPPGDSRSNPLGAALVPGPERLAKQELKRKARVALLEEQYRREIAQRHGVSEAQVLDIVAEGRAGGWPSPPP